MYPWLPWWPAFTKLPLSGNVSQAISPLANWFSPSIEFDIAGDRQIEADVVTNVASYGKQLGVLADAILAVAHGNASPAIKGSTSWRSRSSRATAPIAGVLRNPRGNR